MSSTQSATVATALPRPWTARIDEADVRSLVEFIAAPERAGRPAGEWGYEVAAAEVAGRMARIGLLPLGDDATFLQAFEIQGPVIRERDATLALFDAQGMPTEVETGGVAALAISAAGNARGPVIFAGHGIALPAQEWDDFADLDLKGRVALIVRGTPAGKEGDLREAAGLRERIGAAQDRGAVAVLICNAASDGATPDPAPAFRAREGRQAQAIPALWVPRALAAILLAVDEATLASITAASDGKGAGAAWATRAADGDVPVAAPLVVAVDSGVIRHKVRTHNVLGWLPAASIASGSDSSGAASRTLTGEIIVVGAHLDHLGTGEEGGQSPEEYGQIHPGADDNASGVAGLLEIAEALVAMRETHGEFRRGIVFAAFGAEELGLLGSRHLIESGAIDTKAVAAMLNMDMIGRGGDGELQVGGVGTGEFLERLVAETNLAYGLKIAFSQSGYGPSDHDSFTRAGVPSLFFFTGLHRDYHRPTDIAERVEIDGVVKIAQLVSEVTAWLASAPARPRYIALPEPNAGAGRGYGPYLGTRPSFEDHPDGLLIEGVSEGSPAALAGLQVGDVVLYFDRIRVRNIYDYTRALRQREAGDTATIVVQRGDREITAHAVLTERDR